MSQSFSTAPLGACQRLRLRSGPPPVLGGGGGQACQHRSAPQPLPSGPLRRTGTVPPPKPPPPTSAALHCRPRVLPKRRPGPPQPHERRGGSPDVHPIALPSPPPAQGGAPSPPAPGTAPRGRPRHSNRGPLLQASGGLAAEPRALSAGLSLRGGRDLRDADRNERTRGRSLLRGHGTFSTSGVRCWRLVAGGGRRLMAVDGGWSLAVVGCWWLAVGGGWRRLAVGDWWSLGAVLNKKKSGFLRAALPLWPRDGGVGGGGFTQKRGLPSPSALSRRTRARAASLLMNTGARHRRRCVTTAAHAPPPTAARCTDHDGGGVPWGQGGGGSTTGTPQAPQTCGAVEWGVGLGAGGGGHGALGLAEPQGPPRPLGHRPHGGGPRPPPHIRSKG